MSKPDVEEPHPPAPEELFRVVYFRKYKGVELKNTRLYATLEAAEDCRDQVLSRNDEFVHLTRYVKTDIVAE